MSVANILALAGNKMGLNPQDPNQRTTLVRFLNEAAEEMYDQADVAGTLVEQVFKMNGYQTLALPHYVGDVRAIREYSSMIPWNINQMRPRYNVSNWSSMWRGFRLKNRSPLMASITNEAPVTIVVPQLEVTIPLTVTITGPTALATQVSETLTMTSLSKTTVSSFLDVVAITKSVVTVYDIYVNDADGKMLTVIPNNELQPWYQIVDVSELPWLAQTTSELDHYVEVLYKKNLPYLSNDNDEYPAQGYDIIISNKMMQLWAQEQGKGDVALGYDTLVTRSMARKHENANRATQDKIPFVANSHDILTPRVRSRRPGRYGGYGGLTTFGGV